MILNQKRVLELVIIMILFPVLAFVGGWFTGKWWNASQLWTLPGFDDQYCEQWRYREPVFFSTDKLDMAMLAGDLSLNAQRAIHCIAEDPTYSYDAILWASEASAAGDILFALICCEQGCGADIILRECEK